MVYYTESTKGTIGTQKLMVGKKQKGVLRINPNPEHLDNPMVDQPSLVYHFSVSSQMLRDDKKIQIRLNSEHGEFMYMVRVGSIPDVGAAFDVDGKDDWLGGEYSHVVISAKDLDKTLNTLINEELPSRASEGAYADKLIDIYIRVYPFVVADASSGDKMISSDGMAYAFNIAFYDEGQLVHLVDGRPQRGVVANQTFDYFYFDLEDPDSDYEISLGPISGGDPDLVLSLDPANKFPTAKANHYMSANEFTTDSIRITKEMLSSYLKKGNHIKGKLQAYIGVYTKSPLAVYSIVMTRKAEFNPIKLKVG